MFSSLREAAQAKLKEAMDAKPSGEGDGEELQYLRLENEALKTRIRESESSTGSGAGKEQEVEELRAQLAAKVSEHENLVEKSKQLMRRYKELRASVGGEAAVPPSPGGGGAVPKEAQEELAKLNQTTSPGSGLDEAKMRQLAEALEQIPMLQAQLEAAHRERDEQDKLVVGRINELELANQQLSVAATAVSEDKTRLIAELQVANRQLQDKLDQVPEDKSELVAELQVANQQLQDKLDQTPEDKSALVTELQAVNQQLQNKLDQVPEDKSELVAELQAANQQLQDKLDQTPEDKSALVTELQAANQQLQNKLDQTPEDKSALVAELQAANQQLQDKLDQAPEDKSALVAELQAANRQLQDKLDQTVIPEDKSALVTELQATNQLLQDKLDQVPEDKSELVAELQAANQQLKLEDKSKLVAELQAANELLQEQLNLADKSELIVELQSTNQQLEEKLKLEDKTALIAELRAANQQLEEKLNQMVVPEDKTVLVGELQATNQQLEEQLKLAEERKTTLTEELQVLRRERDHSNQTQLAHKADLEGEMQAVRTENAVVLQTLSDKQTELDSALAAGKQALIELQQEHESQSLLLSQAATTREEKLEMLLLQQDDQLAEQKRVEAGQQLLLDELQSRLASGENATQQLLQDSVNQQALVVCALEREVEHSKIANEVAQREWQVKVDRLERAALYSVSSDGNTGGNCVGQDGQVADLQTLVQFVLVDRELELLEARDGERFNMESQIEWRVAMDKLERQLAAQSRELQQSSLVWEFELSNLQVELRVELDKSQRACQAQAQRVWQLECEQLAVIAKRNEYYELLQLSQETVSSLGIKLTSKQEVVEEMEQALQLERIKVEEGELALRTDFERSKFQLQQRYEEKSKQQAMDIDTYRQEAEASTVACSGMQNQLRQVQLDFNSKQQELEVLKERTKVALVREHEEKKELQDQLVRAKRTLEERPLTSSVVPTNNAETERLQNRIASLEQELADAVQTGKRQLEHTKQEMDNEYAKLDLEMQSQHREQVGKLTKEVDRLKQDLHTCLKESKVRKERAEKLLMDHEEQISKLTLQLRHDPSQSLQQDLRLENEQYRQVLHEKEQEVLRLEQDVSFQRHKLQEANNQAKNTSGLSPNSIYLKNVLVSYMTSTSAGEQLGMVKAIGQLAGFSPEEQQKVKTVLEEQNAGVFGRVTGYWSNSTSPAEQAPVDPPAPRVMKRLSS